MKSLPYFLLLFYPLLAFSEQSINVTDDEGIQFTFSQPVRRIVSLAPHVTELLFAAGATDQVVGTVSYSDYPQAAKKIPVIGSYNKIDMERIMSKRPDLIVAWSGGNSLDEINKLKSLGFKVFISEPKKFTDVAENIRSMGRFMGTEKQAEQAASNFLSELERLKADYPPAKPVRIFYQVWNEPLMTISDGHLVGQVIKFCSGENIFGDLITIAPRVSIEAVIEKQPEVIIAGMTKDRQLWLKAWDKWTVIDAVKNKHVYPIDASLVIRQTPRILLGTRKMCEILEGVRRELN